MELTIDELRLAIQLKLDHFLILRYELTYIDSIEIHTVYSFTDVGAPFALIGLSYDSEYSAWYNAYKSFYDN